MTMLALIACPTVDLEVTSRVELPSSWACTTGVLRAYAGDMA